MNLKQLIDIRIRKCEKLDIRCITSYNVSILKPNKTT